MLVCDYMVEQIDGDYAHLRRVDEPDGELIRFEGEQILFSDYSARCLFLNITNFYFQI